MAEKLCFAFKCNECKNLLLLERDLLLNSASDTATQSNHPFVVALWCYQCGIVETYRLSEVQQTTGHGCDGAHPLQWLSYEMPGCEDRVRWIETYVEQATPAATLLGREANLKNLRWGRRMQCSEGHPILIPQTRDAVLERLFSAGVGNR